MRSILALCLALLLAAPAQAEVPSHGLIENRTGLPLTFPLQVRTNPGRDAYLVLRDAATGGIAVTAYIEGGRFFRLLMPPGTFTLNLALGGTWISPEELFGPETTFYTYPDALEFSTKGLATRSGHLIDLRFYEQEVRATPLGLCQTLRRVWPEPDLTRDAPPDESRQPDRFRLRQTICPA